MGRPFIHVNCASTADGKISRPNGSRLRISDPWDVNRVHRLRAQLGSILVGAGAIISDDPKLTVKADVALDDTIMTKIVVDGKGMIPETARFLKTPGRSIIIVSNLARSDWKKGIIDSGEDVEFLEMEGVDGSVNLAEAMSLLASRGIKSMLVEGGSRIIWEFVSNRLFDLFTLYIGPVFMGGTGPTISSGKGLIEPLDLKLRSTYRSPTGGVLLEYEPV